MRAGAAAQPRSVGYRSLAALVLVLAACGGTTKAIHGDGGDDDGAPDATSDTGDDGCVLCPIDATPLPDGPLTCDAGLFFDAGCVDGILPARLGAPFSCGTETCWSGSQYCWYPMGGMAQPHYDKGVCRAFPCVCGAEPTCGCTATACQPACTCSVDDAGAMLVACSFP